MPVLVINTRVSLSVWLLSLLSVGLLVHLYHLSAANKSQQEEILQLRTKIEQLQEENQQLRDGTWTKVLLCATTAVGATSVMAGVATGAVAPTSLYQIATNILYRMFGTDSSTSTTKKLT